MFQIEDIFIEVGIDEIHWRSQGEAWGGIGAHILAGISPKICATIENNFGVEGVVG